MKKQIVKEVVITNEDYENSSKNFFSKECPGVQMLKREFPNKNIILDTDTIHEDSTLLKKVGELRPGFSYRDYQNLKDERKEFYTTVTLWGGDEEEESEDEYPPIDTDNINPETPLHEMMRESGAIVE